MTGRTRRLARLGLWAPVVIVMAGIQYASVRPLVGGSAFAHSDKLAHAVAYGLLALYLARALRGSSGMGLGDVVLVAFIWSTAYGGVLEVVQRFVGRNADFFRRAGQRHRRGPRVARVVGARPPARGAAQGEHLDGLKAHRKGPPRGAREGPYCT